MLQGHLDAVTSSGFIEGWAYDEDNPASSLTVSIRAAGAALACGIANRYRWDLATGAYGTGWCAFRLKLTGDIAILREAPACLVEHASQVEIARTQCHFVEDSADATPTSLEEVRKADPTLLQSIDQLRGCTRIFADFIDNHGIEAFVSRAYIYVLGRPSDAAGLAFYASSLRGETMRPYDILHALSDSEEFVKAEAMLLAPSEPGFAFHLA